MPIAVGPSRHVAQPNCFVKNLNMKLVWTIMPVINNEPMLLHLDVPFCLLFLMSAARNAFQA